VIRRVFERFDPRASMASLDEAYLDLTEYLAGRNEPGFILLF
jgi:nucleotidyltransferase/DNA polymerase involved in DNA repair